MNFALPYFDEVMADGPVAYWRLGELSGTTATDEMGNIPGTYVGSPTLGLGGAVPGNTSVQFGSGKAVAFSPSSLPSGNASRSFDAWIYPTSDAVQVIMGYGNQIANEGWGVFIATTFYIWDYSSTNIDTGVIPILNEWSHIALTWDGSTHRFYVNGVEAYNSSAAPLNTVLTTGALASDYISFGGAGGGNNYTGLLDEFSIYNYALSPSRIAAHYAARNVVNGFDPMSLSPTMWLSDTGSDPSVWSDISGNGWHATQVSGGSQPSIVTGALNGRQVRRFNGTSQYLKHSYGATGDATICAVLYSTASDTSHRIVISAVLPNDPLIAFLDSQGEGSTEWGVYRSGYNTSGHDVRSSFHVIGMVNTSTGTIFRHDGTESSIADAVQYSDAIDRRAVGASYYDTGLDYFQGDMAEILVFPRALTESERIDVEQWLATKWGCYIGFFDNFNRADGAVGAPWTVMSFDSHTPTGAIVSNQLSLTGQGAYYLNADNGAWIYKTAPTGNFKCSVMVITATGKDYCRHIMFRESLDSASPFVSTLQVQQYDRASLVWRDSYGGGASWAGISSPPDIGSGSTGPYIGLVHSLEYEDGVVTLRDSTGAVALSRACPFVPAYVGLAIEYAPSSTEDGTIVYDNYTETPL